MLNVPKSEKKIPELNIIIPLYVLRNFIYIYLYELYDL